MNKLKELSNHKLLTKYITLMNEYGVDISQVDFEFQQDERAQLEEELNNRWILDVEVRIVEEELGLSL